MKATKIRVSLVATALAALIVPAVVATLGVGSHIALADTITPCANFTASLCTGTKVTIKLGTATVTCNTSSTSSTGTLNCSSAPGTPVCGAVTAPTLTNCTVSASGFSFAATCTAAGNWTACVTPTTSQLTGGTVTCTASVLGQSCKAASGAVTLNGSWTNGPPPSSTFNNQTVSVTTSGGFPCPSGTSATFSAKYCTTYTVSDP